MWRQVPLVGLAVLLAIPPARFAVTKIRGTPDVDRTTPVWKARDALIARAKVFVSDAPSPTAIDLGRTVSQVDCEFIPKRVSGTTPKFDCRLANGEVVKIKYGWSPERHGEVAATRLLAAL